MNSHHGNRVFWLLAVLTLACRFSGGEVWARELKVGGDGFPTIQSAVDVAQPGDTITLSHRDEPYHESIVFNNRSGQAGEPITLDGQGATLDGSEALRPDEWQETATGLFCSTALPIRLRMEPAILMRYFFIFDKEINRMGHASKSAEVPYLAPTALQPGQWTYVAEEKAFYLRLPAGWNLDRVRVPILAAGVSLMGDCEQIQISHLTVQHFWNDGFNVHGRSREVEFTNIRALECGDDGISAHEDCQIDVDGLVSRDNATGFCHIGNSRTRSRNVLIENCASYGIFLLDASHHELENCVIRSREGYALRLLKGTELDMKNVLLIGDTDRQPGLAVESMSHLMAHNVSVWQLPLKVNESEASWLNSVAAGMGSDFTIDSRSKWQGKDNLWDADAVPGTNGTAIHFAGQEANSVTRTVTQESVLKGELAPYGFDATKVPWFAKGEPNFG